MAVVSSVSVVTASVMGVPYEDGRVDIPDGSPGGRMTE